MKERFIEENWKGIFIICLVLSIAFFVFSPFTKNSPFHSDKPSGIEIMVERWPHPEPNDPNFLWDYKEYMGHKWNDEF